MVHWVGEDKVGGWLDWGRIYAVESRRAVLWLPVAIALGIALYFSLAREPAIWWSAGAALPLALLATGLSRRRGIAVLALSLALAAGWLGFAAAALQTRLVAAPVLAGALDETVEGRVVALSRGATGAPRAMLDRVRIYGLDPAATPERVRVTLIGLARAEAPAIGTRIRLYARLLPPGGPVEPGAFDFRRRAFFQRLGAVGYARGAVLRVPGASPAGPGDRAALWLAEQRRRISAALGRALPGAEGAFAAAIVVGDRAGIAETDQEALRSANIAHLLAISGLHMAILTGLVFAATRFGLAVVPGLALRLPIKKLAAAVALLAGAGYLALSGATVATQRAFLMVAVALTAVLIDRPAITLRAVAVAAGLILLWRPISLTQAGFQLSFAATTALVAAYELVRRRGWDEAPGRRGPWQRLAILVARYGAALVFTSVIAGLATAPFAAFHFNRMAPYGLLANLLAVPAMGLWIAPMAILSGLLAPFGWAGPAIEVMGTGIGWVLAVAHWVAALPGAYRPVVAAPEAVLALFALGGLWLALWRGPWRLIGLAPVAVALGLWVWAPARPALLVAPGARLVGLMGPEGRAVDHPRAQSFAAETWLRRDGDTAEQRAAAARPGLEHGRGWARGRFDNGWVFEIVHARRPGRARLKGLCRPRVLLIARHGPEIAGHCRYFGRAALARAGALAVDVDSADATLTVTRARAPGLNRPWAPAPARAAR